MLWATQLRAACSTGEQIAGLVDRRLLRVDEWRGAPRIELTHDLLTYAVREHGDRRRTEEVQREADERLQAEKRELEARSRQQRRRLAFAGVLVAVFLGFAVVAVVQWKRAADAEAQAKRALGNALAGKFALQSSLVLDARAPGGVDIGVLLAVAAARNSLSSDARRMLRMALDRTAALQWSQKIGEKVTYSAAFSPDGKTVASAGYDGTVRLWDVDPESWMRKPCAKLSRNLSREEWALYAGDIPYQPHCPGTADTQAVSAKQAQHSRQGLTAKTRRRQETQSEVGSRVDVIPSFFS